MELTPEKEEIINSKIDELNEKIGSGEDLTQWESVLLDTLEWVAMGECEDIPTFF